jgi:predicted nucleic acid-binding Zn ribbon protein
MYQDHDPEISLFGKILRCTVDEDFWHKQQKQRNTMRELLIQVIKERHPTKQIEEVKWVAEDILTERTQMEIKLWRGLLEKTFD